MDKITINGIEYTITMTQEGVELQYFNEETGIDRLLIFEELFIIRTRFRTAYLQYDVTPTGKRFNEKRISVDTPKEDLAIFQNSELALAIKKSIVNGMLRLFLKETAAVYDPQGNLIEQQPIPLKDIHI